MNKDDLFPQLTMISGLAMIGLANKKKKLKGSRNTCNACHTEQPSLIEMAETISDCNYSLPQESQILEELVGDRRNSGIGSFARLDGIQKLEQVRANQILTATEYKKYKSMLAWLEKTHPNLYTVADTLFIGCTPQQIKLLANLEITIRSPDRAYRQAVKMLRLAESVGVRNFINRYLQRIAILVPPSVQETPLMKNPEGWRYEWTCKVMKKDLGQQMTILSRQLARLGLDLNENRVQFQMDKGKRNYTEKRLDKITSLRNLSMVAWFIAVAKACNISKSTDLLFTYPVENVFTSRGNIGGTVFERLGYKMHIPGGSQGEKSFREMFPTSYNAMARTQAVNLDVVIDSDLPQPYLYYYDKASQSRTTIVYYSFTSGALTAFRSPIFTITEKMNAPSFSIPAGAPQAGGSCISSMYNASKPGFGVQDSTFVCRKCYALKGHYLFLAYVFAAAPRMNWIIETMKADITGQYFANLLTVAIESYARYGLKKRDKLELGYIKTNSLVYPTGEQNTSRFDATPLVIGGTSQDFINFSQEGDIAGYFRIHDSGDFTITTDQQINVGYINSWSMIASNFPQVKFWAPTRAWTLGYRVNNLGESIDSDSIKAALAELEKGIGKEMAEKLGIGRLLSESKKLWNVYVRAMDNACELADHENLIIRPSGLTIISPFTASFIKVPMIPTAPYLAAGSGVNAVLRRSPTKYIFSDAAYELIGFDSAYPPRTPGRAEAKQIIGKFLEKYFKTMYKGKFPKHNYTPVSSMDPQNQSVYQCPVNKGTDLNGNPISSADSCLGSNCRTCWLVPTKAVTYGAH